MSSESTELILFIGGGIVTVALATGVILLILRARREHEEVLRRERLERETLLRTVTDPGGSRSAAPPEAGRDPEPSGADAGPSAAKAESHRRGAAG